MLGFARPAVRFAGLLALVALVWFSAAAAMQSPGGFRSAEFGMSSDAVMAHLASDGVVDVELHQTEDDDLIIDGELRGGGEPSTDLRYVFPAGSDRLALVVAFHPDVEEYAVVKARLEAQHGTPWEEEMTEWWFEQLKAEMPQEPGSLVVWGGDSSEGRERGRFVRLWSFEDYLSVEYLDTRLFP